MNQATLLKALQALLAGQVEQPKKAKYSGRKATSKANRFEKKSVPGLTDRQIKNNSAVVRAFKNAYGINVEPRVDARTYNEWLKVGMRVKTGEKGLFVTGVGTLFHTGQVASEPTPTKADLRLVGEAAVASVSAKPIEMLASNEVF